MFRFKAVFILLAAALAARASLADTSFTTTFSTNPFSTWSFGIGSNTNNQFAWSSNAPPAYAGGPTGALNVALNSSLPTARLQIPLGITLTDTNSFTLSTTFSFKIISAPDDQEMEMAFGLVNSSTTGGDRTGTFTNEFSDNTFSTVEFDYFPNVSTLYGGPTLTPTVIGAQAGPGDDTFDNFASIFGDDSILGTHTNGVTSLPQNVTLKAVLLYDGPTKTITLTISQVNSNGSLTVLDTELPPLGLVASGSYDTNFPFRLDSLAIMAYQDGYTTNTDPSLVANLTFEQFSFCSCEVLPPSAVSVKTTGANVALAFSTLSNFSYVVQSSTDLVLGAWSTIASNIPGTGNTVTYTNTGAATNKKRFYRIGLFEP